MRTIDRIAEQHDEQAHQAAAERIAAASQRQTDRAMADVWARIDARKKGEAVGHLANTLGAAFTSIDAIGELRTFWTNPADRLSEMIDAGLLGYDAANAYVLVPMG